MESLTTIDAVEAMKRRPDRLRRILFVCLGNICRSPAAEGVMRAIVEENEGRGAAVENEWEIDENAEWNEANYTLPIGKYVRMKRLLPGEQVIMTVDSTLYAALSVGDAVQPAAGGTIAKVTTPTGGSD